MRASTSGCLSLTRPTHFQAGFAGYHSDEGAVINIAFDIDGLADAMPRQAQSMMSAFTAAGHHVYIITGIEEKQVAKADIEAKREYLTSLGITSELYFKLIVCPKPHAKNKAQLVKEDDIAVLFDNSVKNCQAAKKQCMAFLLVNAEEK